MKNKLLSLLAVPAFALTMLGGAMSASADMQPDPIAWCFSSSYSLGIPMYSQLDIDIFYIVHANSSEGFECISPPRD